MWEFMEEKLLKFLVDHPPPPEPDMGGLPHILPHSHPGTTVRLFDYVREIVDKLQEYSYTQVRCLHSAICDICTKRNVSILCFTKQQIFHLFVSAFILF